MHIQPQGPITDSGFDKAQGVFARGLRESFPVEKRVVLAGLPFEIIPGIKYQFWSGESKWPVIQYGPGVLTINDIEENYIWEEGFLQLVKNAIEKLVESYEGKIKFNKIRLQYIDAEDLDGIGAIDFVKQNLQTEISSSFRPEGELKGFHISRKYELLHSSALTITIKNGINNETGVESAIWTTTIEREGLIETQAIWEWLEYAHSITSNMFKNMLNPDYYESLDK